MKTNLEEIGHAMVSKRTLLETKVFLQNLKKSGEIFLRNSLASLQPYEYFEMYYCLAPSQKSRVDAFPIPREEFQFYKQETDQFEYMSRFFECYYQKSVEDLSFFACYDYKHPAIGTDYIWMYQTKKTKEFEINEKQSNKRTNRNEFHIRP